MLMLMLYAIAATPTLLLPLKDDMPLMPLSLR